MDPSNFSDWSVDARLDHMISPSSLDAAFEQDLAIPSAKSGNFQSYMHRSQLPPSSDAGTSLAQSVSGSRVLGSIWDGENPTPAPLGSLIGISTFFVPSQDNPATMFSNGLGQPSPSRPAFAGYSSTQPHIDLPGFNKETTLGSFDNIWDSAPTVARGSSAKRPQRPPSDLHSIKKTSNRIHKTQPRKAISNLEKVFRSDASLSAPFRHKISHLLSQMKVFLEEEELQRNRRAQSPSLQSTASSRTDLTMDSIFSQGNSSTSGILDSGYRTEDIADTSATPRPLDFDAQEVTWLDGDATYLQAGFKPLYACTKEHCDYSNYSEVDWRRHEQGEKHWPQERFMCLHCPAPTWDPIGNPICPFCFDPALLLTSLTDVQLHFLRCDIARDKGKTFGRKDHFCKHLRDQHLISNTTPHVGGWVYPIESEWPRRCGFCGIDFQSWEQRMSHIAQHYQSGTKIKDWIFELARPKDSRFRRPDLNSRRYDDDDDDENDFHSNFRSLGTHANDRAISSSVADRHVSGSGNCLGSSSTSHQSFTNRGHVPVNAVGGFESLVQNTFKSIFPHNQPSLPLERYLNDTDEWLCPASASQNEHVFGSSICLDSKIRSFGSSTEVIPSNLVALGLIQPPRITSITSLRDIKRMEIALEYSAKHAKHCRGLPQGTFWMRLQIRLIFHEVVCFISSQMVKSNSYEKRRARHFLRKYWPRKFISIPTKPSRIPVAHDTVHNLSLITCPVETIESIAQPEVVQALQPLSPLVQMMPAPPRVIGASFHRRGPWSQAEDAHLVQLVHTQGALNWVRIAQLIGGRSPKQCRERYHQTLKPTLNHEPISPEEGLEIERLVGEMGKRWAEIARRLHGRSEIAVKNWWNGSMNRRRRCVLRRRSCRSSTFEEESQPLSFTMSDFPDDASTAPSLISDMESLASSSPHLYTPSASTSPLMGGGDRRPYLPPLHSSPNRFSGEKHQPVGDHILFQQQHAATSSEYKVSDFEDYSYQTSIIESSPPSKTHTPKQRDPAAAVAIVRLDEKLAGRL